MSRFRSLLGLLMIVWIVQFVNLLLGQSLNAYGLVPRTASGLPGILLAPLLHGGFAHLASNTGGMIVLGGLVALRGERRFLAASLAIVVIGGTLVWLLGRNALHIGASGLVFGYFGFLLASAWFERTVDAIVIAIVAMTIYSGILWGTLPLQRYISWEAHLAGLLAGVAVARWFGGESGAWTVRRPVD